MGILQLYEGLQKPDTNCLSKGDPVAIIQNAFTVWEAFARRKIVASGNRVYVGLEDWLRHGAPVAARIRDDLSTEARSLLSPYGDILPEVIAGDAYFACVSHFPPEDKLRRYAGLFYTEFLHLTGNRILIVPPTANGIGCWGDGAKKGRIDLHAVCPGTIGHGAKNCCIINYVYAEDMGQQAQSGLFINLGQCKNLGDLAHGGRFITSKTCETLGWGAQDGLYIQMGVAALVGSSQMASNGFFVYSGDVPGLGSKTGIVTGATGVLSDLLHDLSNVLAKHPIDLSSIDHLCAEIDSHKEQYRRSP
ncbi:hypothetical protein HY639_01425 [Candidatus Woesearchaeota archaeon]|nr:hypothetical protein [Candidatus Woesearchaeota archaeon]